MDWINLQFVTDFAQKSINQLIGLKAIEADAAMRAFAAQPAWPEVFYNPPGHWLFWVLALAALAILTTRHTLGGVMVALGFLIALGLPDTAGGLSTLMVAGAPLILGLIIGRILGIISALSSAGRVILWPVLNIVLLFPVPVGAYLFLSEYYGIADWRIQFALLAMVPAGIIGQITAGALRGITAEKQRLATRMGASWSWTIRYLLDAGTAATAVRSVFAATGAVFALMLVIQEPGMPGLLPDVLNSNTPFAERVILIIRLIALVLSVSALLTFSGLGRLARAESAKG